MVRPTREQTDAVHAIAEHAVVKVEALAGTGKTTTLELAARLLGGSGTYITFNRRNAAEARDRFPSRVDCRTAHSLAWAATPSAVRSRVKRPTIPSSKLAAHLGCTGTRISFDHQALDGVDIAAMAWETVQRFIKSADDLPAQQHLPTRITAPARGIVAALVLPYARRIWDDLASPKGQLPVSHDAYLKRWQLTAPVIPGDTIYFDEAQDADPVMLDVVLRQSARQVYVGDRYQAIYGWRGAVNAMSMIAADSTALLTESFRFGPEIAEVANRCLRSLGSSRFIRGAASHPSAVAASPSVDVVLCRTNAEAIRGVLDSIEAGRAPALVGGVDELIRFFDSAERLRTGQQAKDPRLLRFRRWTEVSAYAATAPPEDQELVQRVALAEQFGPRRLLFALRRCVPEADADRTFSTGHRAKGREWDRVRLASDFDGVDLDVDEELRLLYVANTRARRVLDRTRLADRPLPTPSRVRPEPALSIPAHGSGSSMATVDGAATVQRQATPRSRTGSPRRAGKRWTAREHAEVLRRYVAGEDPDAIGKAMGRTRGAVVDRLIKQHGIDWHEFVDEPPPNSDDAFATGFPAPPSQNPTAQSSPVQTAALDLSGPQSDATRPSERPAQRARPASPAEDTDADPGYSREQLRLASDFGFSGVRALQRFFSLEVAQVLAADPDAAREISDVPWVVGLVSQGFSGRSLAWRDRTRLEALLEARRRTAVPERVEKGELPPSSRASREAQVSPFIHRRERPTPRRRTCPSCGELVNDIVSTCRCS